MVSTKKWTYKRVLWVQGVQGVQGVEVDLYNMKKRKWGESYGVVKKTFKKQGG